MHGLGLALFPARKEIRAERIITTEESGNMLI